MVKVHTNICNFVTPSPKPYKLLKSLLNCKIHHLNCKIRLSVLNRIFYMLDSKSRIGYFNGLVLPHLDYGDIVYGDRPGLKAEMDHLQVLQNRFA